MKIPNKEKVEDAIVIVVEKVFANGEKARIITKEDFHSYVYAAIAGTIDGICRSNNEPPLFGGIDAR